jgi:hypothetical protein
MTNLEMEKLVELVVKDLMDAYLISMKRHFPTKMTSHDNINSMMSIPASFLLQVCEILDKLYPERIDIHTTVKSICDSLIFRLREVN